MDFVMVAPDDPLAMGMVDAMEAAGIRAFGPKANAASSRPARLSQDLMKKYGIPTRRLRNFHRYGWSPFYVEAQGAPIVVKATALHWARALWWPRP